MLITTVPICTTVPGRKLPVPRSAAPIATIANCSAMAGMNQSKYCPVATRMPSVALWLAAYASRSSMATPRNTRPTAIDSTCDWLNNRLARAWSFCPAACDTTVVAPTDSTCVMAMTRNERLPARPTAAIASVPSRPTQ